MKIGQSFVLRLTAYNTFRVILLIALMLLMIAVGFYLSYRIGLSESHRLRAENASLNEAVAQLYSDLAQARQRAVSADKAEEIARLANEEVRLSLLTYGQEIADLEADIAFYRGLMAPDELANGLAIHDFYLSYEDDTDFYHYTAILTQSTIKHSVLKGSVMMELLVQGSHDTERITFSDLPGFTDSMPARLRFRFFQRLQGQFKLPQELQPVSIVLIAETNGKNPQKVSRSFQWQALLGAN
ncbi:MAG: hypothetical protein CL691_06845 [Cellvibrionales bacterium]|nr:hypothetical protein [Cellvibrionales bacterium]|tara:strand:+ start:2150 stop:2875 length:726 start_codon:yes stop_codon:yes gene_type:complete